MIPLRIATQLKFMLVGPPFAHYSPSHQLGIVINNKTTDSVRRSRIRRAHRWVFPVALVDEVAIRVSASQ